MGGGVMWTAAKAAAFGGYRVAQGPWVDQATAARGPSRAPPLSAVSSAQSVPVEAGAVPVPVVSWGFEEWEFAGGEEEALVEARHPAPPTTPMTVFGPLPTLEEAKEAASDLRDALELLYYSPPATGFGTSCSGSKSASSGLGSLESLDSRKGCAAILPSPPRHIVQAFSLLQESTEAQNIVASLASDINVLDAVMKNEKVMEFYKTHLINVVPAEPVNENGKNMGNSTDKGTLRSSQHELRHLLQTMKLKVRAVVDSLSALLENFMGTTGDGSSGCSTAMRTINSDSRYVDARGASFIALAIATILLIFLKRGDN